VTELLVSVLALVTIGGLALGWALQRKRSDTHLYGCSRCETQVRSRWELRRCPACMKPYAE
jgi:hypothetical protein